MQKKICEKVIALLMYIFWKKTMIPAHSYNVKNFFFVLVGPLTVVFVAKWETGVLDNRNWEKQCRPILNENSLGREKNPLLEIRKSWQNSFLFQLCNTCSSLWNSKKKFQSSLFFYYFAQMHFDVFYLYKKPKTIALYSYTKPM